MMSGSRESSAWAEFLRHDWDDAQASGHAETARLSIVEMDMPRVQKILQELNDAGFKPNIRHHDDTGLNIHLTGTDAIRLRRLRLDARFP